MKSAGCLALYFFLFVSVSATDSWWLKVAEKQGPMVCPEEFVNGKDRNFSTPWTGGKLCGTETIIRFSCCPGYARTQGERGCPLVKPMKNIAETAEAIGAKQFVKQAEQSGLLPFLTNRGAYTVFVARDNAFQSLTKEQEKALNGSKKSRSRTPALLYTIAEGRIAAEDLPDSLSTLYREGSAVVAKFPNGLIAVNCIPLVATNIEATNGIIHVTESLLLSTGRNTIWDLLAKAPALSTTAAALTRAQLSNDLRDKKSITVFAPTEEAWEALPSSFVQALMEDVGSLKALLQYHIVASTWCSRIISGKTELKTLDGNFLQLSCNETGQYANDARIIQGDFAARNGFLHYIDFVLIPAKVRSAIEYLELRGMTHFLKLVNSSGILPLLQHPDIYTLFVPTNEAFEDLPNETLSILFSQPALARSVASFHVTTEKLLTSNAIDGQVITTIRGAEPLLRLKISKKRATVETALILEPDLHVRNGIIQVIDKVLFPPAITISDHLKEEKNFSIFIGLLNQTKTNLLKTLDNSSSTFTVFAPNDEALNNTMPPGMLSRLLSDSELLYKIMARHILPTFVVSSSLVPRLSYSYETLNGEQITVTKEGRDSLTVARLAEVTVPDIPTANGVLHEISRLIHF